MMRCGGFGDANNANTDLDDEIAYDLALNAEERMRSGISPHEAERASHRDFGNVLVKEGIRQMRGWISLQRSQTFYWTTRGTFLRYST